MLLPNVNAVALVVFGLAAFGRVAAMLNFTAGLANLRAAVRDGGDPASSSPRAASSSRASSTRSSPGWPRRRQPAARPVRILYLEDVRASVTSLDKASGVLRASFAGPGAPAAMRRSRTIRP